MSTYKCPKGHESTESDYCSECGAKIQGSSELAIAAKSLTSTLSQQIPQAVITCPDCTAPHDYDSGDFCEICGYNFVTGAHGELPPVGIIPAPVAETVNQATITSVDTSVVDSLTPDSIPSSAGEETAVALEIIAIIDPSLGDKDSPPPPTNQPPITFQLDKPSNLIGRTSDRRGIHPEISLDFDDAVSHRHALLICQPEGTLIVRDIGSTNGTRLNGVELAAMFDTPIKEGDELTLGHWTRIAVRRRKIEG